MPWMKTSTVFTASNFIVITTPAYVTSDTTHVLAVVVVVVVAVAVAVAALAEWGRRLIDGECLS